MEKSLNKLNDNVNKRHYFFTYLICFVFLYALFVPSRIKSLLSFNVEEISTTNEIWIVLLVYVLLSLIRKFDISSPLQNKNKPFLIIIYTYILIIIVGGFNIVSISQYIYASLLFLTPLLIFFTISYCSCKDIRLLLKVFIVACLIYSIFSIVLSMSYTFFVGLIGDYLDQHHNYSQFRANTMLGSSITVSYYFNMTLPLCFYMFYNSKEKKWRTISALTISTNIAATFILLSRAAVLCTIFIVLFNIFFMKNNKNKFKARLILALLLLLVSIFTIKNYDLSRLALGINRVESSVALRLTSGKLGLHIFTKYPFWGSGMGRYFKRAYTDNARYIIVDGMTGLIDPHNMYILILSEMGMIGFIVTMVMFLLLFNRFLRIKEKALSKTACLTLFAFLLDAMGGSHLFISISFSTLFWTYMGVFNNIYLKG